MYRLGAVLGNCCGTGARRRAQTSSLRPLPPPLTPHAPPYSSLSNALPQTDEWRDRLRQRHRDTAALLTSADATSHTSAPLLARGVGADSSGLLDWQCLSGSLSRAAAAAMGAATGRDAPGFDLISTSTGEELDTLGGARAAGEEISGVDII
jgi:hypothetical protein